MPSVASIQQAINREGERIILRRIATGAAPIDVVCAAVVRGNAVSALAGNIVQGEMTIIIGQTEITAAAWPGPPKKGDRIVVGATFAGAAWSGGDELTITTPPETALLRGAIAKHSFKAKG